MLESRFNVGSFCLAALPQTHGALLASYSPSAGGAGWHSYFGLTDWVQVSQAVAGRQTVAGALVQLNPMSEATWKATYPLNWGGWR